jgi:hypothetical protein
MTGHDHDVRVWLTAEQYLGVVHAAESDDVPMSTYVRDLIRADLAIRASSIADLHARGAAGRDRDEEGR